MGLSLGLLVGGARRLRAACRTPLVRDSRVFGAVGLRAARWPPRWGVTRVFIAARGVPPGGRDDGHHHGRQRLLPDHPGAEAHAGGDARRAAGGHPYGARAKLRSTHNHYMTLPVLFTMLSQPLPRALRAPAGVAGARRCWSLAGAGAKYIMNFRTRTHPVVFVGTARRARPASLRSRAPQALAFDPALVSGAPKVSFATVETIVQTRCADLPRQAAHQPGVRVAAAGGDARHARAHARLGRADVRAQRADQDHAARQHDRHDRRGAQAARRVGRAGRGPGGARTAWTSRSPAVEGRSPTRPRRARSIFEERCTPCHGKQGRGDGPSASALNPKPRNYSDPAWQDAATDEAIAKAILEGGAAVGKSPVMPGNPDLERQARGGRRAGEDRPRLRAAP